MTTNPPSPRPPFSNPIGIGAPVVVLLLGLLQLFSAVSQGEQGPLAFIVPGVCLLLALAMAATAVISTLRWKRRIRLDSE